MAAALAFTGPGRYAADAGGPRGRVGPRWSLASVAVAVGAAVLTLIVRSV